MTEESGDYSAKQIADQTANELLEECESSSEELDELLGFVEIRTDLKSDFKARYVIVNGGSMFWFKDSRDVKPKGKLVLNAYEVNSTPKVDKREHVIELKGSPCYWLAFASSLDKDSWNRGLEAARQREPMEAPKRQLQKTKKESLGSRTKKRMAGDIASSVVGKRVIKSVLNEESMTLLTAMKHIVAKSDCKKRSEELEKGVIKLMVKAYLLIEAKKIESDAFLAADKPLRQAFELLAKCYNARGRAKGDVLVQALGRAELLLKDAERIITKLLQPHLSPKNMLLLASTFGYLGSVKFLEKVYSDDSLSEQLESLVDAMQYYTQFHYT